MPMTITCYMAMFGYIYCLWVYVGDIKIGHCQGACHSRWFFYVPLQVSQTALPFTWSCEPREIHSLQCWRVRNKSPQAYPTRTEDWTRGRHMTDAHATTCTIATLHHFSDANQEGYSQCMQLPQVGGWEQQGDHLLSDGEVKSYAH